MSMTGSQVGTMKPQIAFITLAVNDLEKSLAFYRDGMGLPTEGIVGTEFEDGAVVFFRMNDNLMLALWSDARWAARLSSISLSSIRRW